MRSGTANHAMPAESAVKSAGGVRDARLVQGRSRAARAARLVVVILAAVIMLLPVVWMLSISFKPPDEWGLANVIPHHATFANYKSLFVPEVNTGSVESMTRSTQAAGPAFVNSAIIAPIATLLAVVIGFLAAYAASRFRTRANLMLFLVLVTRMFPPVAFAVPMLVYFSWLGFVDTRIGLILAYSAFTVSFAVWLLKGFIDGVPVHLEEAAMIDGASPWRAMLTVTLPLVRAGIVTTALFVFILNWTEFLFAFVFTQTQATTLPVQISYFVGTEGTFFGPQAALGIVSALPVVVIGYLIQRHLVRGFTFGLVRAT
jgi:multiple sugar transport system permease protein